MDFNADTFQEAINGLIQDVAESTPDIVQKIALDATASIRNRIQERGVNDQEEELIAYSPAYKKQKSARYGEESVSKTNLTLTGDMWRKTTVTEAKQEGKEYVVTVGGTDDFAQNKIDWNSDRYGDIMTLSDQEKDNADETYNNEIQEIIDRNGFGQ